MVDFLWPPARLVVVDGYGFHRTRRAFEDDRRRDVELQRAGDRVVRMTHARLKREPTRVIGELHALVGSPPP